MEDFIMKENELSSHFIPVSSFDDPNLKSTNSEVVSAIEHIVYPWFGFAYRIDRV